MKLTKDKEDLGLPEWMKFGLELEVENLDYKSITSRIKEMGWHSDKDASLTDSGTECVSPILQERKDKSVWEDVYSVCENIEECSADGKRPPYTDHTCGGHVHFDAELFRKNPEMMKNLLRLWAESEEVVYKMCNAENDPIRSGAMNKSRIGFVKDVLGTIVTSPLPTEKNNEAGEPKNVIQLARETLKNVKNNFGNSYRKLNVLAADLLMARAGMAAPIGSKIKKQLEAGKLKLAKPKSRIYKAIISGQKLDSNRYASMNLTNFGKGKKNTIEFRISNGTKNPETIKQNVFLYASILNTAVEMTINPEQYAARLQEFYKRDVSEEEKANAFLGLIMDEPQDRQVYMNRWRSVKDNPVFEASDGSKKFASGTFNRDGYREVANRTPVQSLKAAFGQITSLINGTLSHTKEEVVADGR